MKNNLLSGKSLKVLLLVSSIVCMVVLMIISMNISALMNPPFRGDPQPQNIFTPEKEPDDRESNANKVLQEGEVRNILLDFAGRKSITDITDKGVLRDALNPSGRNIADKISSVEAELEKASQELEDAPDMRSFDSARVKVCIAKSIAEDDMKNVCGTDYQLNVKFSDVDDINALVEILPYFLRGVAYYEDGDYVNAKAYLEKVKEHKQAGIARWNDPDFPLKDEIYGEMYNETLRILTDEKLGK